MVLLGTAAQAAGIEFYPWERILLLLEGEGEVMKMRNAKDLQGLAIVDVQGGNKLGNADEIVVSPENGRLLGFVMKRAGLLTAKERIIEMRDVRNIGPDAITVEGDEVAHVSAAAQEGFQEARSGKRSLTGKKVVTQDGSVIGSVSDYTIDEQQARVTGLILSGGLFEKSDVVPADRIVSVGADVIVVSEAGSGAEASGGRPFIS